ncbi:hypothetical protein VTO42DRAFT_100 [Malbranchea cinnamomea]
MQLFTLPSTSQLVGAILTALATWTWYGLFRLVQVRRSFRHLEPKPPHSAIFGHLGLFGALTRAFPSNTYLHHPFIVISRKYNLPDVFYLDLWPFQPPMLVLCRPDLVAQVTTVKAWPKPAIIQQFLDLLIDRDSIFTADGAKWKYLHSVFAPAFAPAQLRSMVDGMLEEVIIYYDRLVELAQSGEEFSMDEATIALTLNVIGRAVFNTSFRTSEGKELIAEYRGLVNELIEASRNPVYKMLSSWKTRENLRRVDRAIERALVDRFNVLKADRASPSNSIMDLVLRQRLGVSEDIGSDKAFMDMAISNIKTFLLAGHETTAGTLGFIFMLLSKHPEIVEKARQEHDEVFSPDLNLTREILRKRPEKLNDLAYTTAIIKETLRLFPIGSLVRESPNGIPILYQGKELPTKDHLVFICSLAIHYNPEIFPSPSEFRPERFLSPNTIPRDAWRPFERGIRACIGQELAMMEMKMVLLLVLRTFDFEAVRAVPRKNPVATYTDLDALLGDQVLQEMGITAKPRGGLPMRVKFAWREL